MLQFDRFRYDRPNQRLEDASGAPIRLNPKAFDVLTVLIERRGELVSKEQLLDAVWPDTYVTDGVLKVSIAELRRALGDSAASPRVIETVHRRGYRFVAPVQDVPAATADRTEARAARSRSLVAWPAGGGATGRGTAAIVGRDAEIAALDDRAARALRGERQIVFVTGEAGAGKTTLVESFVTHVAAQEIVAVTGSRCLEQFGSAEAYMPVLEAVGRLVREDVAARPLLRRYAPSWFAQLPWLIEDDDRDRLGRDLLGAARERMLREIAEFVEAYGAEMALVLVLDDLHWSDPSTIDFLSVLAARREPARLLLLATYRPAELVLAQHPLRAVSRRLATSGQSAEVALDDLPVAAVASYLAVRFAGSRFPADLAELVRERTDGNPLFLVTLLDHLVARGAIVERDGEWQLADDVRDELAAVPESLRRLIDQQLDRLSAPDRELLEPASLIGLDFTAAAAAAGVGRDVADAEKGFERLAAGGRLVRRTGAAAWPDGTVTSAFAFKHTLYRDALVAALPPRRRAELHLGIATVLERAHGERSGELAAELAVHFEEGGDRMRAVHYRAIAAQTAMGRHAFTEAETHLEKALTLLASLPASPERDQGELSVLSLVGPVRMATRGFAAPEVGHAYTRALALSRDTPHGTATFPMLWGIWVFYAVSGDLQRALDLATRNLDIAERSGHRLARLEAHHALWTTHYFRGEVREALHHLDAGEPLYDAKADRWSCLVYGNDPKAAALGYRALVLWTMGQLDQAVTSSAEGVAHARDIGHPVTIAQALVFAAWVRVCRREPDLALAWADEAFAYCKEHETPFWLANVLQIRGWALFEQGHTADGLAEWERGVEIWNAVRGSLGRTAYDVLLAAAYTRAGRFDEARARLDECRALVASSGEHYADAELDRVDAELSLARSGRADAASTDVAERAQALLETAIESARRHGARTLQLRAATALARLRAGSTPARVELAELLAELAEGLDTPDLADAARAAALSRPASRRPGRRDRADRRS